MFGFFILLHLAGLVSAIVFLIKLIKGKIKGDDISKSKKYMLISLAVWFAAFILMIATTPKSDKTEDKDDKTETTVVTADTSDTEVNEKNTEKTEKVESEPVEEVESSADEQESLKEELKEKYDVSEPSTFARGDKTGKWRIVKVANATPPSDYALDYAKAYMQDAGMTDIHFIVNFSLKTTTKLQVMDNKLIVTTTEYVDKEEHDATIIGMGMEYSEKCFDLTTGKEIKAEADPDAGTVESDDLIAAVKEAIDGQVGKGEKITGVSFDGKDLLITVDVSQTDTMNGAFTTKDIAEVRIDSITDAILDLDDSYYNTWETITLDFGSDGKATFNKSQVKDQGLGKYFDHPADVLK